MTVSAVIPTYNRIGYIRRAIDSVLAQTVPVDEIVVIDDGSTDGTAEAVAKHYGAKVRVVQQVNGGLGAARYRGIQEATGEWIAFLDSDDDWTPDRNRLFLEAAAKIPPDVAWIFGDLEVVTDEGQPRTLFHEYGLRLERSLEIFSDSLKVQFPFQFGMMQGSLIRRRVLMELDCFRPGLPKDVDLITGFEIACNYRVAAIGEIVGRYYRTSDLGASSMMSQEICKPDYYRSRMLVFALIMRTRGQRRWNLHYAAAVRGLAQRLALDSSVPVSLAVEQFRYGGVTTKGVAFACFAIFGRMGVRLWNALAEWYRRGRAQQDEDSARVLQSTLGMGKNDANWP